MSRKVLSQKVITMDIIKIRGGRAFANGVAFASDRCIATALLVNGRIICEVRELSGSAIFWQNFQKRIKIIPRLFVVVVSAWIGFAKLRNRLLFVAIMLGTSLALSFHPESHKTAALISLVSVSGLFMLMMSGYKLRPFHAAEHQTYNSYTRYGVTDLRFVQAQDRFNEKCGTSLIAPLVLVFAVSPFLAVFTGLSYLICLMMLIEISLWVEKLVGWYNVPLFSGLNKWLQLNFTTSKPSTLQLEVAKAALDSLTRES